MPGILQCPKCGLEVMPGSSVAVVADPGLPEDQRIFTEDQMVVAHETCPGRLCESCGEENVFGEPGQGTCEICGWKEADG